MQLGNREISSVENENFEVYWISYQSSLHQKLALLWNWNSQTMWNTFYFIYFQGRDPVIISCSIYLPPHKLLLDTINLQFHYTLLSVSRGASYFNGYS